jgi:peptidoglycan-associated lipoprotein
MTKANRLLGLLLLASVALVGACHKKPPVQPAPPPPAPPPAVTPTPTPPPPPPPRPTPPPTPAPPHVPTPDEIFASKSVADLNREHVLADVNFEYDVADLSDTARSILAKDADYMRQHPSIRITVEGHADSRGTNEYNLALGERRASAVRDYLVGLGVAVARISIVSKGEEEPLCREEVESCWAQNRRGHPVITDK